MNFVRLALFLLILAPMPAFAFVQTLTCFGTGQYACRNGEVAKPVRWPTRCVPYYINEDGTADIADDAQTFAAIRQGFAAWAQVPGSEFVMQYGGFTDEDRAEHENARGEDGNANVVIWRDGNWPYATRTAYAITSVTFDPLSGDIVDADIELNSEDHRFTAGDRGVIVDTANTLTHEAGHFLGLDHSLELESTMYERAPEGEIAKRSLHPDDITGLMTVYPALGESTDCGNVPEYFDKPDDDKKGCCTTASSAPNTPLAALFFAIVGFVARRKRRRES